VSAAEAYPDLFQFLGGYLHQDFDLDGGTADDAVRQAIASTPAEARAAVAAQIDSLMTAHSDERSLEVAVNELCSYHPPGDGLTYRAWLRQVRACVSGPS
jgi:hypothetical protein